MCRFYTAGRQPAETSAHLEGLRLESFHSIAGEPLTFLSPYQIGELMFRRDV